MENFFVKKVIAPHSGVEFTIRRVEVLEYLQAKGEIPIAIDSEIERKLAVLDKGESATLQDAQARNDRTVRFLLAYGVKKPKIFFGDGDTPDGQVHVDDLTFPDKQVLVNEVANFMVDDPKCIERLNIFFSRRLAVSPSLNGEGVQQETVAVFTEGGI